MASCNFIIPFNAPADVVLARIKEEVEKNKGTFNGNGIEGVFTISIIGTLSGNYTVYGQELHISIISKPIFISCGQIENFLKSQIEAVA